VIAEDFRPPLIISVGDVVSENLTRYGLDPSIAIVDGRSLRRRRRTKVEAVRVIRVINEASTLSSASWKALRELISRKGEGTSLIYVEGEEDLLVLPATILAPPRSLIVYGQPSEALVVVIACDYVKAAFTNFLKKGRVLVKQ